jgi:hypothetical protein
VRISRRLLFSMVALLLATWALCFPALTEHLSRVERVTILSMAVFLPLCATALIWAVYGALPPLSLSVHELTVKKRRRGFYSVPWTSVIGVVLVDRGVTGMVALLVEPGITDGPINRVLIPTLLEVGPVELAQWLERQLGLPVRPPWPQ